MSELEKQLKKQVDAFKQIVTLRAAVDSLSRELIDLKRRAIVNVQKQQEKTAISESRKDREEIQQCSDIFELLALAKQKFVEFDANQSGYLDGDEMLVLADWVWSVFSLDGSKIRQVDTIRAKNRLLSKFDANSDGKLDFEEFALWFLETWNALKRNAGSLEDMDKDDANEYYEPKPKKKTPTPQSTPARFTKSSKTEESPYASNFTRSASSGFRPAAPMYNKTPTPKSQLSKRDVTKPVRKSEPWRCLLKYREPARNCIQLFLRFDRSGKNILSETAIIDILERCGVMKSKMNTVVKEFVKKFGTSGNQISLEKFVETLPPKADEKHLYLLVLDVLEQLQLRGRQYE